MSRLAQYAHRKLLWLRTRFYKQRWPVWSLKRRMPPDVYFGSNQWVSWGESGLITEMRPGLLVSDRLSLVHVSVLIYRPWRSYHSRPVAAGSFRLTPTRLVPPLHLHYPLGCQEGARLDTYTVGLCVWYAPTWAVCVVGGIPEVSEQFALGDFLFCELLCHGGDALLLVQWEQRCVVVGLAQEFAQQPFTDTKHHSLIHLDTRLFSVLYVVNDHCLRMAVF